MSLWACPTHGLYGGDVFCPICGGTGAYVTLSPMERAKASHRPMQSVDEIVGLDRERAPCGTRPEGQDGEAGLVRSTSDAVTAKPAGAQGGDA